MKYLRNSSEDEVIRVFLEAELDNPRHEQRYLLAKKKCGLGSISNEEMLSDRKDNERRMLLTQARGWPDSMLFEGLPKNLSWDYFELETDDLNNLNYIDYSYWNELSSNTREPYVAAENIKNKVLVYGQSNDQFYGIASAVSANHKFPPLVLGKMLDGKFVIIEGHARATGFALAKKIPYGQAAIVSEQYVDNWANKRKD